MPWETQMLLYQRALIPGTGKPRCAFTHGLSPHEMGNRDVLSLYELSPHVLGGPDVVLPMGSHLMSWTAQRRTDERATRMTGRRAGDKQATM